MGGKFLSYAQTFIKKPESRGDPVELSYLDLLSPEPLKVHNMGSILSPFLKDIRRTGNENYQLYLSLFMMTPKSYHETTGQSEYYETLSEDQQMDLSVYNLLTGHETLCAMLEKALNFFFTEEVRYYPENHAFFTYSEEDDGETSVNPDGIICKDNWNALCSVILQRNYIKPQENDSGKVKSKKAQEIMKKLKKGRESSTVKRKSDQNMELGNIISALANKHESINMLNVWDLTIYQLWDSFHRLCNNHILSIQSMSVAAWGDKEKRFDAGAWFQNFNIT